MRKGISIMLLCLTISWALSLKNTHEPYVGCHKIYSPLMYSDDGQLLVQMDYPYEPDQGPLLPRHLFLGQSNKSGL